MSDLDTIIARYFGSRDGLAFSSLTGEIAAETVIEALQAAYDLGHERGLGL